MKVLEYRSHRTIQHSTLYRWHAPIAFGTSPEGEARRYVANDFLNLIALPRGARCFPFPALLTVSPDRERKRFLAFARNDEAGKRLCYRKGGILPPSSGRRCPEGAEVGFRCGIEKQCEMCHPVSSSRAQPRDLFRLPFPFSFVKPSA